METKRKKLRLDPRVQKWVSDKAEEQSVPETEVLRQALVTAGAPDTGMMRPGRKSSDEKDP